MVRLITVAWFLKIHHMVIGGDLWTNQSAENQSSASKVSEQK